MLIFLFWYGGSSKLHRITATAGQGHADMPGMVPEDPLSWLTDIYAVIHPSFISVAGKILLA